ncbi:MAG: ankyrin repeat domain-containing protein [Betaproteobacteria bacterium]|nr:ankyrin repeat domain-containing protein [Betaproteobacteria bacterium]
MTSLMKTKSHMAMEGLWEIISEDHDFARAKKMLLKVGIEGPTPSDLTPIHAALNAMGGLRAPEQKKTLDAAIEFICWAFAHGATPHVDYLSEVARWVRYSHKYTGPTIKYAQSTKPDYHGEATIAVIDVLLDHHVPVELQETPLPDPYLVRLNKDSPLDRLSSNEGFSPLHFAAEGGYVFFADYLLEKCNASIDKRSTFGMTPLLVACCYGQPDFVRTLLDHGADSAVQNVDGRSAMSMCDRTEDARFTEVYDLLELRERYRRGPINGPSCDFRNDERIHRTARGDLVRSKSEVIIADALFYLGCEYQYEEGIADKFGRKVVPDFVIQTPRGTYVWEHAGMMGNAEYREKWETKAAWYKANGYTRDVNLFVTMEDGSSGIDSHEVREIVLRIKQVISKGT